MIKTINASVVTPEMRDAAWSKCSESIWSEELTDMIRAALEAAPEVKAEPVSYTSSEQLFNMRERDIPVQMWSANRKNDANISLYTHPPAQSDLVERIRALKIAEPIDWVDRSHNSVIAKIIELIEGAK